MVSLRGDLDAFTEVRCSWVRVRGGGVGIHGSKFERGRGGGRRERPHLGLIKRCDLAWEEARHLSDPWSDRCRAVAGKLGQFQEDFPPKSRRFDRDLTCNRSV